MGPAPVALQLYTIREVLAIDFEGSIRRIAQIGYAGVEVGFPGTTDKSAIQLYRDLRLDVPSAHVALPLGDAKNEVLDTMSMLGCSRIVAGINSENCKTVDLIKAACGRFNEANAVALENRLTLHIHNHWWEYLKLESRSVQRIMMDYLAPEVCFEVDTYWAATAGADPVSAVRELGPRAPLLHIKDGPCMDGPMIAGESQAFDDHDRIIRTWWEQSAGMTAVGEGVLDFHAIVKAGSSNTEWLIVELDKCPTDMIEAVEKSYRFLIRERLGRGN